MPLMIGLAGLGLLGRGIAACLLEHGFSVIALESSPQARKQLAFSDRLTLASEAAELSPCEFVIESISEDFAAKSALFEELEQHIGAEVPLVTNTSAIPISLLQVGLKHPGRFAGMHWTTPAESTRFLEIIRGESTTPETLARIEALALELDKEPGIVQKDLPGFVANRIAYAMYREALHLVKEGVADPQTIDVLCQHSIGMWASFCGPFRWMDITGGPALYATAMERIIPTLDNSTEVPPLMRKLHAESAQGTQNGRGFYSYEPSEAAEWQARLREHALAIWELGNKRS